MARLGLEYHVLREWNPRLIMVSSIGMGQTGPWAHFRGFGSHFEALYGHASVTGYPDMDAEGAPASVAADAATGVGIGFATVMALHQRERTGRGTHVRPLPGRELRASSIGVVHGLRAQRARGRSHRQP